MMNGDLRVEFAEFSAPEDFLEAMIMLRDEDREPSFLVAHAYRPLRAALGWPGEDRVSSLSGCHGKVGHIPGDAEEEHLLLTVDMFVQVEDVSAAFGHELRDERDEALSVRA